MKNPKMNRQKSITEGSVSFPESVKEVRRQLGLSQEALANVLGVSFATINRWENSKTVPFRLARTQFDEFCEKMKRQKKLKLPIQSEE